jgi:large subunit ribosomal protein L2
MGLKQIKPTTPGRRKAVFDSRDDLTATKPHKPLTQGAKSRAGRNHHGRITIRHRGSGVKRKYRMVDFKQADYDIPGTVVSIEYDPNRTARIALIALQNGKKLYVPAVAHLKVGDTYLASQNKVEINTGVRTTLQNVPEGVVVSNVEMKPGKGGQMVRAAGAGALVMGRDGKYTLLKLPSKEVRKVLSTCMATVGTMSFSDHKNTRKGKAGITRRKGIRPTVRGKAMNPVDHPHGGGEARNSIGMKAPKTPWGKKAMGVKTRKKTKRSNRLIVERRKKRK